VRNPPALGRKSRLSDKSPAKVEVVHTIKHRKPITPSPALVLKVAITAELAESRRHGPAGLTLRTFSVTTMTFAGERDPMRGEDWWVSAERVICQQVDIRTRPGLDPADPMTPQPSPRP
jgi:hypothetical protein